MWQLTWNILCDTAIYILIGFGIAGLLQSWIVGEQALRWLGSRSPRSVFLAALVGAPLPLCSCGVLPAAVTLRRKGASRGATLSFLISTPETSVTSILITYSLLGPLLAIFRPIAACITAVIAGFVENFAEARAEAAESDKLEAEQSQVAQAAADSTSLPVAGHVETPACCHSKPAPPPEPEASCCHSTQAETPPESEARTLREGMQYAFVELFDNIFHWIVIGIIAAAAIQVLLPPELFEQYFGSVFLSMLVMLVISVPLYVCAEASTPIAAALIAQGLNPGAALVLLLAGPATNIGAVGVLSRELGRRAVVVYLVVISIISVVMGVLLNLVVTSETFALGGVRAFGEPLLPQWLKIAGAVVFLLLGLRTIIRQRYWTRSLAWFDARLPLPINPRTATTTITLILLAAYSLTGVLIVNPGEIGVVQRFGAITQSDLQPGLHLHWPWPIDTGQGVPVQRVNRLVLGAVPPSEESATDEAATETTTLDPTSAVPTAGELAAAYESSSLLGDENIADVKVAVHWGAKPGEVIQYAYAVADQEELVRAVTMGAVREVLGSRSINRAFTAQRRDCELAIEDLIRQRLSAYNAGIRIDSFQFLDAHAPPEVHDAFRDVASALEDKSTQINLALRDEARKIPLARGEAEQLVTTAEGYAAQAVADARGQVQRYVELLRVRQQWPDVTQTRLYYEMLERVLPGVRKYIKAGGEQSGAIDIWLIDSKVSGGVPWQGDADTR